MFRNCHLCLVKESKCHARTIYNDIGHLAIWHAQTFHIPRTKPVPRTSHAFQRPFPTCESFGNAFPRGIAGSQSDCREKGLT